MIYEVTKYDREDEWSAWGEDADNEIAEYLKIKMEDYGVDPDELPVVFISGNRYEVYLDAESKELALKEAKRLVNKQLQERAYNEYRAEQQRNYHDAMWGRRGW